MAVAAAACTAAAAGVVSSSARSVVKPVSSASGGGGGGSNLVPTGGNATIVNSGPLDHHHLHPATGAGCRDDSALPMRTHPEVPDGTCTKRHRRHRRSLEPRQRSPGRPRVSEAEVERLLHRHAKCQLQGGDLFAQGIGRQRRRGHGHGYHRRECAQRCAGRRQPGRHHQRRHGREQNANRDRCGERSAHVQLVDAPTHGTLSGTGANSAISPKPTSMATTPSPTRPTMAAPTPT